MRRYEAPAKLNLGLHVAPPEEGGLHPVESIVQTIEWCDRLEVSQGEPPDSLEVVGLPIDTGENAVIKALREARLTFDVPPLQVVLEKEIPIEAGLGGGSSDAAAAMLAAGHVAGYGGDLSSIGARVGADVPLFFSGGTLRMTGFGEEIEKMGRLSGFAFAVVQPQFGLATNEVYARWDRLEGPVGEPVPEEYLPPGLRGGMPMRNDLLPAALDLEPRLGDFIADLRAVWGTAACLTGSGSACFGYFSTIDEAGDAAAAVSSLCAVARGVELRDVGVAHLSDPNSSPNRHM